MAQNTSSAVMAQRSEPHDSLDFFPTPCWATRALCEELIPCPGRRVSDSAWDPACGTGDMARPLRDYFTEVWSSDVHDYGHGAIHDFLMMGSPPFGRPDWIITNPPFRLAESFIKTALQISNEGVAMLVRTSFLEGVGRHRDLFKPHAPSWVLQFSERVPMHKGRLTATGSTATAYCWLVWLHGADETTRFDWIAPCRKRLERPGDYPEASA